MNEKHFIHPKKEVVAHMCVCALSLQLCLTLCDPMDCSPWASSVHGILQARILEWVAISYSRGPSQPRDPTQVSCVSRIAGGFFTTEPPGKPQHMWQAALILSLETEAPFCVQGPERNSVTFFCVKLHSLWPYGFLHVITICITTRVYTWV